MKPILFNTEMVQAILRQENPKTQTRRIVKYNKEILNPQIGFTAFTDPGDFSVRGTHENGKYGESFFTLPFKIGDVLYIAEEHKLSITHDIFGNIDGIICEYKDGSAQTWQPKQLPLKTLQAIVKRKTIGKWQRGRFLPKALASKFIKVTEVKAERLQQISEADAIAEGIQQPINGMYHHAFCALWQSVYGIESWNANPWVFAYTFEKTTKPE